MLRPLFGLSFALICACVSSGEAQAYQLKTTATGSMVRWPEGQRHIRVVVDPAMDAAYRELVIVALAGATDAWSSGGQVVLMLDADGLLEGGPVVLVTWPIEAWPYDYRELAVTAVRLETNSGAILSATTRINDDYAWSTLEGAHAADQAHDLQSVLAHELGHALGLAHSEEREATMYAGASMRETKKRTLEDDDRAAVIALYGSEPAGENAVYSNEPPYGCTTAAGAGDLLPLLLVFGLVVLRDKLSR